MQQVPTKKIRVVDLMKCRAFYRGFREVKAGRVPQFDYAFRGKLSLMWNYERGRLFACLWPRNDFYYADSNKLCPEAVHRYRQAITAKEIV